MHILNFRYDEKNKKMYIIIAINNNEVSEEEIETLFNFWKEGLEEIRKEVKILFNFDFNYVTYLYKKADMTIFITEVDNVTYKYYQTIVNVFERLIKLL